MSAINRPARPETVEFNVKAQEDLSLIGKERSIVRVHVNNMYSCLMQKTQRFSSLFRHYSKHHGLPRDSLDFYFINRLDPEDSPESVHLQKNDIIFVRHRKIVISASLPSPTDESYFQAMRELYVSGDNADITLEVGPQLEKLHAHRLILMTRCEIFRAMFRKGAMCESEAGTVRIHDHSPEMVSKLLEYIYTNRVSDIAKMGTSQLIDLLALSEQYLMSNLKQMAEVAARDLLTIENVGRLLCAAEKYNAGYLKSYCLTFYLEHSDDIIEEDSFKEELENCPSMALTLLKAANNPKLKSPLTEPSAKRRRLNMPQTYFETEMDFQPIE